MSINVKVTQIGSPIGKKKDQQATLIGLGLNKINRFSILRYDNSIAGMIRKVEHLIHVEYI